MSLPSPGLTIRDPLWDTIRLDEVALRIVDSAAFQRLRYIKQLGHAHLVYPGATHTRFDHAVGVYHLARRAILILKEQGALERIDPLDCALIPFAALLHDIGHYPFSHALEELESDLIPGHHEALVGHFFTDPDVAAALRTVAGDAAPRIEALVRGQSTNPLQGLVSGSLDLDKIDYLRRDARFCGVPYGDVDVDRLLHGLLLLEDPATGRLEIGVHEKAVAALESLLFAKYQMFRNVYWHHAVRAATVMYKRVVSDALRSGLVSGDELVGQTDEGVMFLIDGRAVARDDDAALSVAAAVSDIRARRLPKRAAEVVAAELDTGTPAWLETDSETKRAVEDRLAEELGLETGFVYLDYPEKSAMFGLNILLERRTGDVVRLGPGGRSGLIGLPAVSAELYRSARVLRLFTRGERRSVSPAALSAIARMQMAEIETALASRTPFLRK
ncbi:MAG TPA: HD domain-containing protein [Longimicrobiales bacterium]